MVHFFHSCFISLHQNALLMEIIERPAYLGHIVSHLGKGMMIILVRQRKGVGGFQKGFQESYGEQLRFYILTQFLEKVG